MWIVENFASNKVGRKLAAKYLNVKNSQNTEPCISRTAILRILIHTGLLRRIPNPEAPKSMSVSYLSFQASMMIDARLLVGLQIIPGEHLSIDNLSKLIGLHKYVNINM